MSTLDPQQRRELTRTAVLNFLAERPVLSFDLPVLTQRVNESRKLDFKAEEDEVLDALAFLEGADLVTFSIHGLGSTRFYQVTSAGVLASERGTLSPRPL